MADTQLQVIDTLGKRLRWKWGDVWNLQRQLAIAQARIARLESGLQEIATHPACKRDGDASNAKEPYKQGYSIGHAAGHATCARIASETLERWRP